MRSSRIRLRFRAFELRFWASELQSTWWAGRVGHQVSSDKSTSWVYPGWYIPSILTKDNLAKRNWHGCKKCVFKCVFCHHDETIKLYFSSVSLRILYSQSFR